MDLSFSFPVGPGEFETSLRGLVELVAAGKGSGFYDAFRGLAKPSKNAKVFDGLATHDQSDFLNWDTRFLSTFYPGEESRRLGELPYSKLVTWSTTKNIRLDAVAEKFRFGRRSREWKEAADSGYQAIRLDRKIYNDGHAIRLFAADVDDNVIRIQPALYTQQAQSNLIADYAPKARFPADQRSSLRQMMARQYPHILPPLDDMRLANTLGIAVLVLCHDDEGLLRPLVQIRAPTAAAMNNSGIHCTGSKAAAWPSRNQSFTVENFFDDEAYAAVEKDFDLRRDRNEVSLYPVALVREHARMGKPQLFYFGYTKRSLTEILKFRLETQRERESKLDPSLRKYRSMSTDQFRKLILTDIWEDREKYKITHEAYAMLYILLRDFGSRD